jgi:hypothetical protein
VDFCDSDGLGGSTRIPVGFDLIGVGGSAVGRRVSGERSTLAVERCAEALGTRILSA